MPGTIADSMCFSPSRPCSGESGCTDASTMSSLNSRSRRPTPTNVPLVPRPGDEMREARAGLPDDLGPGRVVVRRAS